MTRAAPASGAPELSRILFGTWRLLADPDAATPAGLVQRLKVCLDHGITSIDTAEIYGGYRVEELVGEALRLDAGVKSRTEIVSKAGIYVPNAFHPDRKFAHYNATAPRLMKSVEKSLRFLGVDQLDLFLVHRPDWLTPHEETANGLRALLEAGKVRSVGVSNYTASQFEALASFLPAGTVVTNQVEFSPFCPQPIHDGSFDQCQRRRIRPMAWSPTGGGRLFLAENEAGIRTRAVLEEMRARYEGVGDDALCHAWVLAASASPFSVLGTTKPERIISAARAADIHISREDWYGVLEAAQGRKIP